MLDQFRPYIGSKVLEAGCGAGNLTLHLIDRPRLAAVDIDVAHVESVRSRFGHLENFSVVTGDLTDQSTFDHLGDSFDSVICINVLEHLHQPEVALQGFRQVLRNGGHALILVPAHDWLFSAADEALGHTMRYESGHMEALLYEAGFEIVSVRQFNRLGVLGWLVNKALHRTDIGRWQARAFGFLMPVARLVERVPFLPGLSLIAIGRAR
jgi:SAM-dependent methyltransferase